MTEANIIVDTDGDVQIARIVGQLDESNVDEKVQDLYKIVEKVPNGLKLVLDLAQLEYMNSKSIGYITDLYGKITESGGKVAIAQSQPNILDILQVVGLTQLIENFENLEDAKASVRGVEVPAPEPTPVVETPVVETPVVETPVAKNPAPAEIQPEPITAAPIEPTPINEPLAPVAETPAPVPTEIQNEELNITPAAPETPVQTEAPIQTEAPVEIQPEPMTVAPTPAAPAEPAPIVETPAPAQEPAPAAAPQAPEVVPPTPAPQPAPENTGQEGTYKFEG